MTIKAFVTGGTGFVGGNLVRLLLEKGYEVKALAQSGSKLDNLKDLDLEIVTSYSSSVLKASCELIPYSTNCS